MTKKHSMRPQHNVTSEAIFERRIGNTSSYAEVSITKTRGHAMEILPILAAAASSYIFGSVWYSSLSQLWMDAVGLTEEDIKPNGKQDPTPFIIVSTSLKLRQIKIEFSEILTSGGYDEKIKIYRHANNRGIARSGRWHEG